MELHDTERLSRRELEGFFDGLFPNGFAGLDVVGEIAAEGWEQSPLVACFHEHHGDAKTHVPLAEPTLEDVRREYQPRPVRAEEELIELMASCLWDV